ncbi:hypothetical protein [Thermogymnomonas acidicola]|uniref:hypothetical protein n=1 Tax=Thermogymnomonas acidicola TaxID=399579 RepID=UPI000946455B|nr:hypothetical protein [Thermogymnomonas acidicola]
MVASFCRAQGRCSDLEFGTLEYMREVQRVTNGDSRFAQMMSGNDASFTFVMEEEPERGRRQAGHCGLFSQGREDR